MTPIPPSIPANGLTDVTLDLQNYFNGLPDGSIVDFPANGQYLVQGQMNMPDVHGMTWNGNHARIFTTDPALEDRNRSQVRFVNGTDLVFRDLIIEGGNPSAGLDFPFAVDQEAQHTLLISHCINVLVENCEMHYTFGDGIYIGRPTPTSEPSQDIICRNNYITHIGRQGITPDGAERVLVTQNFIDDIKRTCVDLEPPGIRGMAIDITITNNFLGRCANGPVNATGELGDLTVTDNVVDRLGFRFAGHDHDHTEFGRSGKFTWKRNHSYRVKPDTSSITMVIGGWEEAEITHGFQEFGGNKNNFHRFLQVGNTGHTELTDNQFVGLQPGRVLLVNDTSEVNVERNIFWPLGYAVEPT